jgi:hypothetical protein
MGGMAEEYFHLGVNLHYLGKFTLDTKTPFIFRPPGYPFFIASVLKIWGGMPDINQTFKSKEELDQKKHDAYTAIYLAQCILLGLSTVILFLWMSNHLRLHNAFILALLFGCNPYMLILTGLLHYDVLHIFFIIISSYVLTCTISSPKGRGILLALAGILWGLTTLIRPITLILPPFVFLVFLIKFKFSWQAVLKSSLVFTLAMISVIAPYTIRNYSLTRRFIPVNAQGSIALWAGTVRVLDRAPNHFRWWNLWYREGMQIYSKITKVSQYSYPVYMANLLELEDEFKKQTIRNLRNQPIVYFHNFVRNFATINLDINSVFIKLFQVIQDPAKIIDKEWFQVGNQQDFYPSSTANAFKLFINILTVFGFLGICTALRQKDKSLLVPALLYLCICIAHCLTYMDLMYYYIKVPFLYIFTGFFIDTVDRYTINVPLTSRKFYPALVLNSIMIVFTLGLIIGIIL